MLCIYCIQPSSKEWRQSFAYLKARGRPSEVLEVLFAYLLGVEAKYYDVAHAFRHLPAMDRVSAAVLTVDGGAMATLTRWVLAFGDLLKR